MILIFGLLCCIISFFLGMMAAAMMIIGLNGFIHYFKMARKVSRMEAESRPLELESESSDYYSPTLEKPDIHWHKEGDGSWRGSDVP